ncbi:MAG: hypothetical protein ACL93V_10815 [Candidatus Electrothrix sp. YB6]
MSSDLSDIGFDVNNEEAFYELIEKAYGKATSIKADKGTYFLYSDSSGAELWIQISKANQLVGVTPYYKGTGRRTVCLSENVYRKENELDGAFYSWADPADKDDPESGVYPFVFDVPNHNSLGDVLLPQDIEIQLSAFAQEVRYYENEEKFEKQQKGEAKWASQSFVSSGLFHPDEKSTPKKPPEAFGIFSGIIKQTEKKKNELTGQEFQWMLVDTLGGEVDVLADLTFFNTEPKVGGVVQGQFWLTGQLLTTPLLKKKKGIINRVFGKK